MRTSLKAQSYKLENYEIWNDSSFLTLSQKSIFIWLLGSGTIMVGLEADNKLGLR